MDEDDLAGENVENADYSFERTGKKDPEFFRKRQPKKPGKVNEDSTVTVVDDSEETLHFNTVKEHKDSSVADQHVKTHKADSGKKSVDNLETSGSHAKEKKKKQSEKNPKKRTPLRFDDEKPVKDEHAGVLSKTEKSVGTVAGKTAAAARGFVHAKIAESEDDNTAVEAAHSTEIAGETSAKLIHSHLKGTKPETAKLKFEKSEPKSPEIGVYKVNSKTGQKKGIQKTYADSFRKVAKTGDTIGKTADVTSAGTSALTRFRRRVGSFVRRNKAGIATLLFCPVMCLIKRYIVFECSMTKSELINCILQKMDKAMDPVRAQGAVNQILEYLAVRIASGEKIEIRRFGSFSIRLRAARVARNPRTGEILNLSAVKVCYFKPGKVLNARVNGSESSDD